MKKRHLSIVAALVALLAYGLATCQNTPTARPGLAQGQFAGKVVAVHDGDTLTVMHDAKGEKIRLYGVDAPELAQAYGMKAKQFTSEACFGREVTVTVQDKDRYGRTVGEVILSDGRSLNQELVRAGMGWWYRAYAKNNQTLEGLESDARAARRGLWADKNPTPPWAFRKTK